MMTRSTRRTFIASALTFSAAAALPAATHNPAPAGKLLHHVFFWLKNPDSEADRDRLIAGIRTLTGVETVRGLHIGVPAAVAKRPVVDASYSVSALVYFDDIAGEAAYQPHPIHQQFVKDCSPLWSKVVIYDTIAV
jgi:hypothetical protein